MKVAIYAQYYQENTQDLIRQIFIFFQKNQVELVVEKHFMEDLIAHQVVTDAFQTFSKPKELDKSFAFFIGIGGDGTILRAATIVRDSGIPVLGINSGRLGFLASIQQEDTDTFLQYLLDNKYTISDRSLISLTTTPSQDRVMETNFALNEITVSRKDTASMITVETYLNGEFLNSYWADGLIISTPTGSTGYSMSCGGPILTPDVKCLVITPIAPHNLNARPLVIPDDTEIRLKVSGRESQFLVSLDSRIASLATHTTLAIQKTPFKIKMIDIPDLSFFKTLRNKLLWGADKRN